MAIRLSTLKRRAAAGQQYAIVVGLVAVLAIASVATLGGSMRGLLSSTGNTLSFAANSAGATSGVSAGPADLTPDSFIFAGKSAAISSLVVSDPVTVAGFDGPLTVSVSGGGSPKLHIDGGPAVTSGPILPGQTLTVEATTVSSFATAVTATVTLGTYSTDFVATSSPQDLTPDSFTFAGKTGAVSTLLTSDPVTVTGFDGPLTVSVSGGGSPKLRIAGGGAVTSGSISPGQTLTVEATTSASYSSAVTATVTLGTYSTTFVATSAAQDTTPNSFTFNASSAGSAVLVTSNIVTPTGYDGPLSVSVTGGGTPKIIINGGTAVTSGSMSPGQTLAVQLTSSSSAGASLTATVTLGTYSTTFVVTTSAVTTSTPQYGTELSGNGTAGIIKLRYWAATVTGNVVKFDWPLVYTSGATYNGGCSNSNGYWQSLHSGCGNSNGVAGCKNFCLALGMTYNSVNTNCSTGNFPGTIPSPAGRNIYATNSGGTPTGAWECYVSDPYAGNGNNMAWCQCNQ